MLCRIVALPLLIAVLTAAGTRPAAQTSRGERLHREYYPNGNVKYEALVNDHGGSRIIKWFDEDGNPRNGARREGLYEHTYKNGVVIGLNKYYKNGALEYKARVVDHEVIKLREYDENGQLKNGTYKVVHKPGNYWGVPYRDGKKHGTQRNYESGILVTERDWVAGESVRKLAFHKNRKVRYVIEYDGGQQKSRKDFRTDGSLETVRTKEDGIEIFQQYREDGSLSLEHVGKTYTSYYAKGSVQQVGQYDEDGNRHGIRTAFPACSIGAAASSVSIRTRLVNSFMSSDMTRRAK